jgi:hypothetical protein
MRFTHKSPFIQYAPFVYSYPNCLSKVENLKSIKFSDY